MLKKSDKGWMFTEERILEDFIWLHLERSLDLIPLKRQFTLRGEYCDILAKTKDNQLVVLELKNCEDRHIIHQLTRYYHSLTLEQPFKDSIDYNLPIRLIAITPAFHRHNFVDRQYNNLEFEFIRFSIVERIDKFYLKFHLAELDEITIEEPIPFVETNLSEIQNNCKIQVDPPPKMLVNFLDKIASTKQRELLRFREKMLASDPRIKEIKDGNGIFYGRGKTKPCCHLKFHRATESSTTDFLRCYLWLPLPERLLRSNKTSGIGRIQVNCDPDFIDLKTVIYCTQDGRYAIEPARYIDTYLNETGLKLSEPIIDRLFELAVKLNLERN